MVRRQRGPGAAFGAGQFQLATQVGTDFQQVVRATHVGIADQRRFGGIRAWHDHAAAGTCRAQYGRQYAVNRAQLAGQGQFAKEFMALQQGARNAVVGSQDAQRNRQVETTTILGQVSRSEPDRHLALRILKLAIEYGGAYPVACFANGGFRQADNRGARQAAGQMHFADHQWRIHAFLGTTVDDGKTHGTQVLGGSIDSSAPLPA